ncbi:MAG: Rieske 2Fe-2S domain-containing protein [Burkholderiales bacterium]
MADKERLICDAGALVESGRGVRFEVDYFGEPTPAFVVRFAGTLRGYLNRCSHVALELDWREGEFFGADGRDLICSAHGAVYDPASGACRGGPCNGAPLVPLRVSERDGKIFFLGFSDD